MSRLMKELQRDHKRIDRVLSLLEAQLDELAGDGDPDLALMQDALDYVEHYPDLVHHPREDVVYMAFRRRSLDANEIIDALLKEHASMPAMTREFRELVDEAVNDALVIPRETLVNKGRRYTKAQRSHLNTEEGLLFPLLKATLDADDWEALEALMPAPRDPMFDAELGRYSQLYAYIKSRETVAGPA
ncbi:hemerythrin domain-containing protein [Granulosicoccaceae sp. 1_MG-2023]|nr:hemerythrin domain-containing protein [Granulosicoccaceae sp. 1_MG-2023]